MMICNNDFLSMKQAASYLSMEYESFRYHVKRNRGPNFSMVGKMRVFTKEWLDSWNKVDRRKKSKYSD